MARGSQNANDGSQVFFMNIKGKKKGESIHITQEKALGEKKTEKLENIKDVAGVLKGVELRDWKFEDNENTDIKLTLKDTLEGEVYFLSCTIDGIGRSIVNSLLSITDFNKPITISVYNKKDTGYAAVSVKTGEDRADWKFSLDEQAKFVTENTVTKQGKTKIEKDYYNLNQMLIKEVRETLIPKFGKVAAPVSDGPTDDTQDSDLPF